MNFSFKDFTVEVFHSISGIREEWDANLKNNHHLRSGFLLAMEQASPLDVTFRYVLVKQNRKVVAVAYLQVLHFNHSNFNSKGNSLLLKILRLAFRLLSTRVLICGNIFRIDFPCLVYDDTSINLETISKVLALISSGEKCRALLIKDLPDTIQINSENSLFQKFPDSTMTLSIDHGWHSFDDYVSVLSKKYKKRAKKIRNDKTGVEIRNLSLTEVLQYKGRIGELFLQTSQKQAMRMGIVTESYFSEMMKAYGETFFVNGYFVNDTLIAFASHFIYTDWFEVHYIGIDYTYNEKHSLYFNILFDGVEQAILLQRQFLELGRTAREAKAIVGCKPAYFNDYLYVKNSVIRKLIYAFQNDFGRQQGEAWKNRHPFRNA